MQRAFKFRTLWKAIEMQHFMGLYKLRNMTHFENVQQSLK